MRTKIILLAIISIFTVKAYSQCGWKAYVQSTTSTTLCDNSVNVTIQDSDGTYWFGTSDGVSKFDGTSWTTYTTSDGLVSNVIYSILQDTEKN